MSASAIIAIAIIAVVLLGAVLFVTNVRRRDTRRGAGVLSRETKAADKPTVRARGPHRQGVRAGRHRAARALEGPRARRRSAARSRSCRPIPSSVGVTRRQFLNRSSVTLMSVSLGGFGAACIAFLWPKLGGGFGSKITVDKVDDVLAEIRANDNFFYLAEGRAWLTEYPAEALPKAEKVYPPPILEGMKAGDRRALPEVPAPRLPRAVCATSQWFECPCHGSQYNRVGEKKGGPAPRGMDRFAVSIVNGNVVVEHRRHQPRPPDRHEHDGPRGRGPALHHGRTLMVYATAATTIGVIDRGRPHRRLAGVPPLEPAPRPSRGRRRAGAGAEPQALPERRGARGAEARADADLRRRHARGHRRRAAALLDRRAGPPGRRGGRLRQALRQLGRHDFETDGQRRVQLRRLPRWHEGHGRGRARTASQDPTTGEVTPVNWRAPALNTVLYRFSTDEVTYIITYGRPFSPMSPWGLARRRPHERPADLRTSSPTSQSIQIPMAGCKEGEIICDTGHLPPATRRRPRRSPTRPTRSSGRPRPPSPPAPTSRSVRRCSTST